MCLGGAAGLHRTYIGHLERGEVSPNLLNILKIAVALDIGGGSLIDGLEAVTGDPKTA